MLRRPNLSRRMTGGRYLPEVDGLRFFCIVPVVLAHLAISVAQDAGGQRTFLARLLSSGSFGVEFFFLISGFILTAPFIRARRDGTKVPLGSYYLRRLTRLEPPYLVALLLIGGAWAISNGGLGANIGHLAAGTVYGHGLLYEGYNPLFTIGWSLEIEVQFYVLLPLVASIFRLPPLVRRSLLAASVVAASVSPQAFSRQPYTVWQFWQFFAVGMLLADLFVTEWRSDPRPVRWLWPAGLVMPVVLGWLVYTNPGDNVGAVLIPWVALAVAGLAFLSAPWRRLLTVPAVSIAGGMCYSIYLLHQRVIDAVHPLASRILPAMSFPAAMVATAILVLPVVAVVATTFFVLVERPCMVPRWPILLWRRRREALAAA